MRIGILQWFKVNLNHCKCILNYKTFLIKYFQFCFVYIILWCVMLLFSSEETLPWCPIFPPTPHSPFPLRAARKACRGSSLTHKFVLVLHARYNNQLAPSWWRIPRLWRKGMRMVFSSFYFIFKQFFLLQLVKKISLVEPKYSLGRTNLEYMFEINI